jgi:methionyl aminopeptidase
LEEPLSIETEQDLVGLRQAGRVVALALAAMRDAVEPGITTGELDVRAAAVLREHGARAAPEMLYAFPGTACISVNDEAVHGVPGPRRLEAGDLVKLDVTIELNGYYADAAETVCVPPAPSRSLRLIECAEAAFWRGASEARAGRRLAFVGRAVEAEVKRRGFHVLRELCGHGIGRAIHEEPAVCNYYDARDHSRLGAGMVLALEPIVADGTRSSRTEADGWTISSADGSLTAHYEHTIVITRGRPLLMTSLS